MKKLSPAGSEFIETIDRLIEFSEKYSTQEYIVIHNDFRPQNILFGLNGKMENTVVGIVDFDWICLAPPVKDRSRIKKLIRDKQLQFNVMVERLKRRRKEG